MDYSLYNYSNLNFRESGSRQTHGVEELKADSSDDTDNKISQILKDISQGSISVESAVAELKNLGVDVQETLNDSVLIFSFKYNNKFYSITTTPKNSADEAAEQARLEELKQNANNLINSVHSFAQPIINSNSIIELNASQINQRNEFNKSIDDMLAQLEQNNSNGSLSSVIQNLNSAKAALNGGVDGAAKRRKAEAEEKEAETIVGEENTDESHVISKAIGTDDTNDSQAEKTNDVNIVEYSEMYNSQHMFSKQFIESLVNLDVLNCIDDNKFEFNKDKANEILKEFGIETDVNDVFDFVNKLPKVNEAAGEDSKDKALLEEHPDLFLNGTFGGPYHAININALKEYFKNSPELISTIKDADTLQKAINNNDNGNDIHRDIFVIPDVYVTLDNANIMIQNYINDKIENMASKYSYSDEYLNTIKEILYNIGEKLLSEKTNEDGSLTTKKLYNSYMEIDREIYHLTNPATEDGFSNCPHGFVANIINAVFKNSIDELDFEKYADFNSEFANYIARIYEKEDELEQNGYINLLNIIQDENGDGNAINEIYKKLQEFVNDTINGTLPPSSLSEKELYKYGLTKEDIQLFFTNKNGRYIINKSVFGNDATINTVEKLLDAIKNIGLSESMIRGGYKFDSEEVNKYFTVINQSPRRMVLNENAIKTNFPDLTINTPGQLLAAIGSSESRDANGYYTKEYLTTNCQFTEEDLSRYFNVNKGGKYSINQDYIKQILPDKDIKTIQDLVNNIKDAVYDSDLIMHSEFIHYLDCFTEVQEDGKKKFKLNNDGLTKRFPNKDIRTLGQLREAINGCDNDFILGDINDYKSTSYNLGYLKDFGLSEALINEYFVQQEDGKYILNPSTIKSRFPNDNITNAEELFDAIKSHKTTFTSKDELLEFGLSEFMVENFFKENTDGTFGYDLENMKYYFADDKIPYTIEDLKNANLFNEFWRQGQSEYSTDNRGSVYEGSELGIIADSNEFSKYWEAYKNVIIITLCEKGSMEYGNLIFYDREFVESAFDAIYQYSDIQEYAKTNNVGETLHDFSYRQLFGGKYEEMYTTSLGHDYYNSGNPKKDENDQFILKVYQIGYTSRDFANAIINGQYSDNYQVRFTSQMLMKKFNELGLNEEEIYNYIDLIHRKYGQIKQTKNIGLPDVPIRYEYLNFNSYEGGIRGYYSELYNLYKIIGENAANIKHIDNFDIQSATTIDSSALFKDTDFLNAEYIESHLSEMLLSDDPGIRKFATMIQDLFNRVYVKYTKTGDTIEDTANTKAKRLDRIKWLITLLNEKCGVQNPGGNPSTTNVGLTPELLQRLGSNTFEQITMK